MVVVLEACPIPSPKLLYKLIQPFKSLDDKVDTNSDKSSAHAPEVVQQQVRTSDLIPSINQSVSDARAQLHTVHHDTVLLTFLELSIELC